ncbi:MAG: SH3 domain-containing protein [Alphaproteobacteria bacterium]|nr:SH3 domain-containing protein [Alphaproteobacteria bacterium]
MTVARPFLFFLLTFLTLLGPALAQQNSGLPVPRFVSLGSDEVNMRTGPGVRYPVQWVYQREHTPVEIIAEHDTWRKVRDAEGVEGWVHRAMLSGRRSVMVKESILTLRRDPQPSAPAVARLGPGMVATIEACDVDWCAVSVQGYDGWLRRAGVWGLYPNETPN